MDQLEAAPISPGERLLVAYARRFPLRKGKLRLVNALWRLVSARNGTNRVARLTHGHFVMRCDLRDMLQRQFYFFGTYFLEDEILQCWMDMAKNARTVLDVGANAGIYSLAALAAKPEAEVHAFEPTPEIAAGLRDTARLNELRQLHVHEVAIFSADTEVVLRRFRGDSGDNEGMNFITSEADESAEHVPAVRLDSFCAREGIDHVDLLKIDIQGHEAAALLGAERLLAEGRIRTIFLELNWTPGGTSTSPGAESVRLLDCAGYLFSRPGRHVAWRPAGDWLRDLSDIVACKPETRIGSS